MSGSQEQNRSEEATPFKLQKAREKGQVARSTDLGFFGALVALASFLSLVGPVAGRQLSEQMRAALLAGSTDPTLMAAALAMAYPSALRIVLLLGGTVLATILLLELVQLRGLFFSPQALKPDVTRVNPAKGLKRIFSMQVLKEAAKSLAKLTVYVIVTWMIVRGAISTSAPAIIDGHGLAESMWAHVRKLLWAFVGIALGFALLDQVLVRKAFAKQMRMSRREVTREAKEREGDPRQKSKRKEMHAGFREQSRGLAALPGSDLLVVNPEHVAVAMRYDEARDNAPVVRVKARDLHALIMKRAARRLGVPIIVDPPLARALYRQVKAGREVPAEHYRAVADLYLKLSAQSLGAHSRD